MSSDDTLGVVIPTVGQREDLERMLDSILNQTRPVQEIRIVVDASDTTLVDRIVAGLGPRLDGVDLEVISTGVDRGQGEYLVETGYGFAVNRGLERLDTDLVAFLDDDDELRPTHFQALEQALDPGGGVGVAYSRVEVITPEGNRSLFPEGGMPAGKIPVGTLIDAHPVLLPACLIHRSALDAVPGLDESLDREADTDMIVRLGLATGMSPVDDPSYVYYRISRKAVANERTLAERAKLLHKHQAHLTRDERLRLWDSIASSALRSRLPGIGRDAAEQVVSAWWDRSPGFLVSWYLALRTKETPSFLKRMVQRSG